MQVEKAIANGYPLEAIALLDSMITDRLEAYYTKAYNSKEISFLTLDKSIKILEGDIQTINGKLGKGNLNIVQIPQDLKNIIPSLKKFTHLRNETLHEFMKIEEGKIMSWSRRCQNARKAAKEGMSLFKKINTLIQKFQRGTIK